MKIEGVPFQVPDWSTIEPVEYPGETGVAIWRTIEIGNLRVRKVEYSANYLADHWCHRGHVLLVLEGEMVTELQDGRKVTMSAGMNYQVAENAEPHRSSTAGGASLFIVD